MGTIQQNIAEVEKRVADAAARAGRKPEDVLLLAVSKTKPVEVIKEAVACGLTSLGENKVQEIMEKYEPMGSDVHWHLIGHLQTNKVKYIIDKVCMIHSVDSLHLAEEIDRRAAQHGLTMDILVEVNAAGDEAKFGVDVKSAEKLVNDILESCPHVRVRGLMTIAPYAEDPEEVRPYFREMKQLYDRLAIIKHDHLDFKYLSMGMSNDRVIAVEEGSTVIRVGTAIFGARNYNV